MGYYAGDILHHEIPWLELAHEASKLEDEVIPLVAERSLPPVREALARRTTYNNIDVSSVGSRDPCVSINSSGDAFSRQVRDILLEETRIREVEGVDCRMNRVIFDGCYDIKPSLFKSQRQASRASEKIDSCGSAISAHVATDVGFQPAEIKALST